MFLDLLVDFDNFFVVVECVVICAELDLCELDDVLDVMVVIDVVFIICGLMGGNAELLDVVIGVCDGFDVFLSKFVRALCVWGLVIVGWGEIVWSRVDFECVVVLI